MSKTKQMNFKKLAMIATGTTAGALVVSNTVFRKMDPRARALLSSLGGFLILSVTDLEKKSNTALGLGFIASGFIDFANSLTGGAISENKYNGYIWVLMEDGQTLRKLKPYQTIGVFRKIDGISTPFKPGHVFKVPNGCLVKILPNGDIDLSSSFSAFFSFKASEKAGWKNESFLEKFPSWQGLFEKSLEF